MIYHHSSAYPPEYAKTTTTSSIITHHSSAYPPQYAKTTTTSSIITHHIKQIDSLAWDNKNPKKREGIEVPYKRKMTKGRKRTLLLGTARSFSQFSDCTDAQLSLTELRWLSELPFLVGEE